MEIRDMNETVIIGERQLRSLIASKLMKSPLTACVTGMTREDADALAQEIVAAALPPRYKEPMTRTTSYGVLGGKPYGVPVNPDPTIITCEGEDSCVMDSHCHNYANCRTEEGRDE